MTFESEGTALTARFEKRFAADTKIRCDWSTPATGFSITVLFGPSGCGKTTILRCLAGLERPESGQIQRGDEVWFSAGRVCLPPQRRGVGFLFQDYALFPHLTVRENIAYGLSRVPPEIRRQRVGEILQAFDLHGLEERLPRQISGGQQQRVALARALVCQPKLLLLDEPLSALDQNTREEIRRELRKLLSGYAIPVVIVTHDRTEAIALADQVLVLDRGGMRQSGPVAEVFSKPASLDVAKIVGVETILPGQVVRAQDGLVRARVGEIELTAMAPPELDGRALPAAVHVCFRAEDVLLENASSATSARNQFPATIVSLSPEGPLVRVGLKAPFELTALVTRPAAEELALATGKTVTVLIKAQAVHLIVR